MDRLESLLEFYREDPEDSFTVFALASEYAKRDNVESALKYFNILVSEHPDYVGTYFHLGKLYEKLDRLDDARSAYTAGIKISEKKRDMHSRSELQSAMLELDELNFD